MTILRLGVVCADEPIDVAEYGDVDLWLDISLAPSKEGRLRQAIYKPTGCNSPYGDQSTAQAAMFRAPVPILAAGFSSRRIHESHKNGADTRICRNKQQCQDGNNAKTIPALRNEELRKVLPAA
jgi:hypothetical protein